MASSTLGCRSGSRSEPGGRPLRGSLQEAQPIAGRRSGSICAVTIRVIPGGHRSGRPSWAAAGRLTSEPQAVAAARLAAATRLPVPRSALTHFPCQRSFPCRSRSRRTLSRARCRTASGSGAVAAWRQRPTVSRRPLTNPAQLAHSWQCRSMASHAVVSSSLSRYPEMCASTSLHVFCGALIRVPTASAASTARDGAAFSHSPRRRRRSPRPLSSRGLQSRA